MILLLPKRARLDVLVGSPPVLSSLQPSNFRALAHELHSQFEKIACCRENYALLAGTEKLGCLLTSAFRRSDP